MSAALLNPGLVLGSLLLLLALLIHGRVSAAVLFTTWASGYFILGLVGQETFLASYTNPALATLVILLLISIALERSGGVQALAERVLRGGEAAARWRLSLLTAVVSAFVNNTAVVASLLGTVSRQRHLSPSRLLIPFSYASVLGGITTLVGTSTNLVVNSLTVQAGLPALGMFQFSAVGVPVALLCLGVLVLSARLLPKHGGTATPLAEPYFLEARVQPDSPLVGRSIEANGLRKLPGLFLLEIVRNGRLIAPVGRDEIIEPHDDLIFTGEADKVQFLRRFAGLQVFGAVPADDLLHSNLMEVVLTQQSELVNKTLQEVDFRQLFDAGVVGIRRGNRRLTGQLGRITLKVGDSLLLAVGPDFLRKSNLERNFYMMSADAVRPRLYGWKNTLTVGGFAAVIAGAALGWVPLLHGLLVLLGALLVTGILNTSELRRRFPFDLWLIVGSALVIAQALERSGAATLLVEALKPMVEGQSPWVALAGIYLLTWLLTELVTNNAAAALAFPVALATAHALEVDPTPFVMIVAYGASACFLLPFGYQTHLMVYSAGRYRLQDYAKVGWPVSLAYAAGVLTLVPMIFPFH